MVGKSKFTGKTKSVGLRVEDLGGSNREYLVELGQIFQELAQGYSQADVDRKVAKYPKGHAIIEAIPE